MKQPTTILTETRAMLSLALPVVADQIGMMSMGLVDTIMVGNLGKNELGAVGIGAAVYYFYMVFSFGVVSAVSPTVAQAFGAGDRKEIERVLGQSLWIVVMLTAIGIVVTSHIGEILHVLQLGESAEVIPLAEQYVHAVSYGIFPNLMYAAIRAFTVGLGRTRVTMVIAITASLLNVGVVYILIFGKLGVPAFGVAGAGYATAFAQLFMLAAVLFYVLRDRELRSYRFLRQILPIDFRRILRLLRLGLPIGISYSMEQGVFAFTTILMGRISTVALASHQVAINLAAFTFMTPLGISTAITTRVGQAIGRNDPEAAALAGRVGVGIAAAFMTCTAAIFLLIPETLVSIYNNDPDVLEYASGLLMIAGAFQIFDGIQVSAMGALRGMKDTTRPMLVNLLAYWGVGLPCGYILSFELGYGGYGLWWGLTAGLAVAAVLHSLRFRKLTRGVGQGHG